MVANALAAPLSEARAYTTLQHQWLPDIIILPLACLQFIVVFTKAQKVHILICMGTLYSTDRYAIISPFIAI